MKHATIPTGQYRHNKSGKLYEVLGTALHTEDESVLVVYRPLYKTEYELFARPLEMFTELVTINGQSMPRFERTDSARSYTV